MTDQKQPDDLLGGIKNLVQQYKELNTIVLKDGPKILTRLIANPDKAKTLQRINKDIISPFTAEWLNLSQQHIENLLALSKTVTHRFQHLLDITDDPTPQKAGNVTIIPSPSPPPQDIMPRAEILLRGQAGATVKASFNLNSARQEVHSGQFASTPFYHEKTGETSGFMPAFDPLNFAVSPGIATPIEISVSIPEQLETATYRSRVVVLGFDQTSFDIVLTLEEQSA